MADTYQHHPGLVPVVADGIDTVATRFCTLQRKYGDEGQDDKHAGQEDQEGIGGIQYFQDQWAKIGKSGRIFAPDE